MDYLSGIYVFWYREVLRIWRDRIRLAGNLAMPLLWLVVFGGGFSRIVRFAPDLDFTKFMFPGIIAMTVLMTSFATGFSLVWERELGFLREVLVAPVSRGSIVLGKALGGATVAMFQGSIMLALAPLIGISLSPVLILKLWPLMLLLAAVTGSMGILLASRMKSMESFQLVMQTTIMPMVFLSGVFFPVGSLPSWMNIVVKINPATYGVDAIRQVMLEGVESGQGVSVLALKLLGHSMSVVEDMIVLVVVGVVMVSLAMWSFSHQE